MSGPGYRLFGAEEIASVLEVLESGEITRYRSNSRPSMIYTFERFMENFLGVEHCVAVNSGTSALMTGLNALQVRRGDEIIVPGYTFSASIAAIVHSGAVPVLAEIDDTLTLDPADVRAKITGRTKAIMAVHMLGAPCDMQSLSEIASAHGIALIEDVCQACGATYQGARLGSFGTFGAFSLNMFKTITAGDGGWLSCRDEDFFERAYAYHDHGFKPFRVGLQEDESRFGLNLKMSELAGAIAVAQTTKLPSILARLRDKSDCLKRAIGTVPGARWWRSNDSDGALHTIEVLLFDTPADAASASRALGTKPLKQSYKHYYGLMPQLAQTDARVGPLPHTDDLLSRAVAITVGVEDAYLGAAFGVNVKSTSADIETKAAQFHRLLMATVAA